MEPLGSTIVVEVEVVKRMSAVDSEEDKFVADFEMTAHSMSRRIE